jgi:GntR family transcriptional regulator
VLSATPAGTPSPTPRVQLQAQLVDEFGVSRPTVRAAVQLLVERGLVRTVRGKGSFVVDTPPQA